MRSPQTTGLARPRPGIAVFHRTPRPLGNVPGLREREAFRDAARADASELWPVDAGLRCPGGVRADPGGHDESDRENLAQVHDQPPAAEYNPSLTVVGQLSEPRSGSWACLAGGSMCSQGRALAMSCAVLVTMSMASPLAAQSPAAAAPAPAAARTIDLKSPDGIALKASYFARDVRGLAFSCCTPATAIARHGTVWRRQRPRAASTCSPWTIAATDRAAGRSRTTRSSSGGSPTGNGPETSTPPTRG